MERQPVQSSVLKSAGYDAEHSILELEFEDGDVYQYFDFPEFLYRGLMLSDSKGRFLNSRIVGRYRNERAMPQA